MSGGWKNAWQQSQIDRNIENGREGMWEMKWKYWTKKNNKVRKKHDVEQQTTPVWMEQ